MPGDAIEATAVNQATGRARIAKAGLLAVAAANVAQIGVLLWLRAAFVRSAAGEAVPRETWEAMTKWVSSLEAAMLALLLLCAIVYLRWLHRTTAVARLMGTRPFEWTPERAVTAFFIPIVNFVRPYQVLRDVHESFAFDTLPRPTPRVSDTEEGYRIAEVVEPPPPPALPRAFIAAWWAMYMAGALVGLFLGRAAGDDVQSLIGSCNVSIAHSVIEIAAALLGVRVVSAVSARMFERHRRRSFAAPHP